jgi:lipoprotein-releasing system permease protein
MIYLLGFERRVATRFLSEGRVQTLLIVIGVAAGVAVIAYISALVIGLQSNTFEKTLGTQAHVTLQARDNLVTPARPTRIDERVFARTQARAQQPRSIANWQTLMPILESAPGIAAVSPKISAAGLALRGEASRSVSLTGVDLDQYERIVHIRPKMIAGVYRLNPGEAMIGRELASDLGLTPGDHFNVLTGLIADSFRVTALLDLGGIEINRRTVIIPLRAAQSMTGLAGGATSLEMALKDVWSADDVAKELSAHLPYKVESWQQVNAQLVSALSAQSMTTAIIRLVVLVVVILGIASVMVVSVVQKNREIGILRAIGATQGQILRIFLLQGAMVSLMGSVIGIGLAYGAIYAFTHLVRDAQGLAIFNITLSPLMAFLVAAIASICGTLAAVLPARRAAALDPAKAIRL